MWRAARTTAADHSHRGHPRKEPLLRTIPAFSRRLVQAAAGAALFALTACSQLPATASVAVPPIPAGEGRVWFYRDAGPFEDQSRPYIRMNDLIVGILEPLGAFYRDVPPGHYLVSVDQYLTGLNQTRDVDLSAGQQVYLKIVALNDWIAGGGADKSNGYSRPAFYVWLIPAEVAQGDVAHSPFYGGS